MYTGVNVRLLRYTPVYRCSRQPFIIYDTMDTIERNTSTEKTEVISFRGSAALKLHLTQLAFQSGYTVAELLSILAYQAEDLVEGMDDGAFLKEKLHGYEQQIIQIKRVLKEIDAECRRGRMGVFRRKRKLKKADKLTRQLEAMFDNTKTGFRRIKAKVDGVLKA